MYNKKVVFIISDPGYLGGLNYFIRLSEILKEELNITSTLVLINYFGNPIILERTKVDYFVIPKIILKVDGLLYRFFCISFLSFFWGFKFRNSIFIGSNIIMPRIFRRLLNINVIAWWPDFQFLDFPQFFSKLQILSRKIYFKRIVQFSDSILVQSEIDKTRLKEYTQNKIFVWGFYHLSHLSGTIEKNKFKPYFEGDKYFLVAQQGWKHKNLDLILDYFVANKEYNVIFCGDLSDPRDVNYTANINLKFSRINSKNIKVLGRIDQDKLNYLIQNCSAVINLSSYEGWNSQVEEAYYFNKPLILSDIEIFRIQSPEANFVKISGENFNDEFTMSIQNVITGNFHFNMDAYQNRKIKSVNQLKLIFNDF